jgi:pimeloyl-ACP methyl ester carboxylesterase
MPCAQCPGARIYYETRGAGDAAPLLMIHGLGAQMIGWRAGFLDKLVERGLRPILFDNRDVGLSQKFGGAADFDASYTLDDMADDAFGVLDALDLPSAHVVGQSMGGMIAQHMALRRPERVRSLGLIYTAPGTTPYLTRRNLGPAPNAAELYARRDKPAALEAFVERERLARSTAYPFDELWIREWAQRSFERCYAPDGVARQAAALRRSPDVFEGLEQLRQPALILHGRADLHIEVAAALELGRQLRNSELHLYPGLGHEIAEPLWSEWAGFIERVIRRGESERPPNQTSA